MKSKYVKISLFALSVVSRLSCCHRHGGTGNHHIMSGRDGVEIFQ